MGLLDMIARYRAMEALSTAGAQETLLLIVHEGPLTVEELFLLGTESDAIAEPIYEKPRDAHKLGLILRKGGLTAWDGMEWHATRLGHDCSGRPS